MCTKSFHVRHQRHLRCSPQLCVIIPETKIAVHARLASETRCDTAFIKLVGSPRVFSVSAEFLLSPLRDRPVPTEGDGFENGCGGKSGWIYSGEMEIYYTLTDYLWLCVRIGKHHGA